MSLSPLRALKYFTVKALWSQKIERRTRFTDYAHYGYGIIKKVFSIALSFDRSRSHGELSTYGYSALKRVRVLVNLQLTRQLIQPRVSPTLNARGLYTWRFPQRPLSAARRSHPRAGPHRTPHSTPPALPTLGYPSTHSPTTQPRPLPHPPRPVVDCHAHARRA